MAMKSSLFVSTAIAIFAANCVFAGPAAAAADEVAPPEIAITEPADQAPPMDTIVDIEVQLAVMPVIYIDPILDEPQETGGLDPIPVPYELGVVEVLPEVHIDPPVDETLETGGLDPIPVPYELGVAEGEPEPEVTDIVAVSDDLPDLPLPEDPTRVLYYSLGAEGFDPTVLRNFGLEEDPAAAAVERVLTKAVDQAADTAVQPLTPAPL